MMSICVPTNGQASLTNRVELPEKSQKSVYLSRLVRWIKTDRPLILKVAIQALALIAAFFACLTIVGIPFVYLAFEESHRQDQLLKARESQSISPKGEADAAKKTKEPEKAATEKPAQDNREVQKVNQAEPAQNAKETEDQARVAKEQKEMDEMLLIITNEAQRGSVECQDFLQRDKQGQIDPQKRLKEMQYLLGSQFWKDSSKELKDFVKKQVVSEMAQTRKDANDSFVVIIGSIGVKRFDGFPTLSNPKYDGDCIAMELKDLTAPVMKGFDCYSRPFIAFKVFDRQTGQSFAQTIFQRWNNQPRWVCHSPEIRSLKGIPRDGIFNDVDIGQENLQRFIGVLDGLDPRFSISP